MRGFSLALALVAALFGCREALLADSQDLIKQESAELNRLNDAALKKIENPAQYEGKAIQVKAKVLPRAGRPGEREVEVESVKVVGETKGTREERSAPRGKGVLDDELSPKPPKDSGAKVKALHDELAPRGPGVQGEDAGAKKSSLEEDMK